MNWEIATAHHPGGRDEQEDRLAHFSNANGSRHLLVMADGMGGHHGGRLASQTVIEVAQLAWHQWQQGKTSYPSPRQFLQTVCEQAHQRINKVGQKFNVSPHSTCVLLYLQAHQAWWAYLGDSRLYHFRQDKLLHRTDDHSVVQLLVTLGRLKESQMAQHPDQGKLLKWLGGDTSIAPELGFAKLQTEDSLVLCTDGFWAQIAPEQMAYWLPQRAFPLRKIAKFLVAKAVRAGGLTGDNVAVILIRRIRPTRNLLAQVSYVMVGVLVLTLAGWSLWNYLGTTTPELPPRMPMDTYGNVSTV